MAATKETLEKLTAKASELREATKTLEARLRAQMNTELASLRRQVDKAAGEAYSDGWSKVVVGRGMGTSDYKTYDGAIQRGLKVDTVKSSGQKFSKTEEGLLHVQDNRTQADFEVVELDGKPYFSAVTPLYNEDFSELNHLVAGLASQDGQLYDEAVKWLLTQD